MNRVVKYLTGPVRRAWRVRGFGVHSPFAYAYLRSVIHPQGGARYYAEDSIASRRGRLLYRAAVEAGPEAMLTVGPDTTLGTPSGEIRTYVATDPEAIVHRRGLRLSSAGRIQLWHAQELITVTV